MNREIIKQLLSSEDDNLFLIRHAKFMRLDLVNFDENDNRFVMSF